MANTAEQKEKKDFNMREFLESNEYAQKRAVIQKEINSNKVEINYDEFKKSPKEKAALWEAKQENRLYEKRHGKQF